MTTQVPDQPAPLAPRVLLVEDDRDLSTMLANLLTQEGYQVELAQDGQRGLHLGLTTQHDVMIIDRGLPAIEGVDLIRRLRRQGVTTPVLVLTARGTVTDRIEGLDAGAEDYLVKPFDVDELLARLRALLRRHADTAGTLHLGVRHLVVAQRLVTGAGPDDVELSPRECALLEVLARRPSQVFTREDLLNRAFGSADTTNSVDTYVHYVRRKLGRDVIRTVRGHGYRMGSA
jgi:two-component system, OmpR family, response regulator QseB